MQKFQEEDQALFLAIESYKNGDKSKANIIYESTKKYAYKVVSQEVARFKSQGVLTSDEVFITEDVMQELYLNFFHNIANFRNEEPRSIFKWISIVSHRMILAYVDKNKMEVLQFEKNEDYREDRDIWDSSEINDEDLSGDREMIPEAALEDREFRQLITDFIQSLPEVQAQTILLHFHGGLKYQEIADEMGVSLITVKTRMRKAKDSLEEMIHKYEKKTGTKLYSVSVLPLLWLLYRMSAEEIVVPMAVDSAVKSSLAKAGASIATKAIGTKVLIGIVSAAVVIGGAVVGSNLPDKKPGTSIENEQNDYDDIIDSFVSDKLNTFELTVGDTHAPGAKLWLESGDGSVYTSDESVVTVTDLGKVTAVGEGTAYVIIGAMNQSMYEVYCYHVYEEAPEADLSNLPQIEGIDFKAEIDNFAESDLNTYTVKIGEVHQPTASVWANGDNCYTSDASVVTVAGNGTVTAVGKGTAYVIIKSQIGNMFEIYKYVVNG